MTHSPTPWKVEVAMDGPMQISDADRNPVTGVIFNFVGQKKAIVPTLGDLKHIAKCVNLHEELVELLGSAEYHVRERMGEGERGAALLHTKIKALLAKAKGE